MGSATLQGGKWPQQLPRRGDRSQLLPQLRSCSPIHWHGVAGIKCATSWWKNPPSSWLCAFLTRQRGKAVGTDHQRLEAHREHALTTHKRCKCVCSLNTKKRGNSQAPKSRMFVSAPSCLNEPSPAPCCIDHLLKRVLGRHLLQPSDTQQDAAKNHSQVLLQRADLLTWPPQHRDTTSSPPAPHPTVHITRRLQETPLAPHWCPAPHSCGHWSHPPPHKLHPEPVTQQSQPTSPEPTSPWEKAASHSCPGFRKLPVLPPVKSKSFCFF